jgi:RNA polymerase sigma-70 factor, ECF subfamily
MWMEVATEQPLQSARESEENPVELLSLARRGDTNAFGRLCLQYEARLLRQARTLCSDNATAEDLAQESLIAAWTSLGRFNDTCRFFTWLCAILLNLHRHGERKNWYWRIMTGRGPQDPDGETGLEHLADASLSASAVLEEEERLAQVHSLLRRLPRKQREVVFLRFFADESLEGIAVALDCSVGTVKSRLFNGLEKLRKIVGKEFEP